MRLKGFFWFLTILLTAVCIYQLSFTWVASNVEKKAEKEAVLKVNQLKEQVKTTNEPALLPNNTYVDFKSPEDYDLAKAAFINEILREKGDKPVYPVIGSTFSEVKKRSLAFGLDLVGGMSVTLEISIPDLIKSHAKNPKDLKFMKAHEAAMTAYKKDGGDFLSLFIDAYRAQNAGLPLNYILKGESIGIKSSDADVENYFRKLISSSMDGVEQIMSRRINQFGVAQPNIQKDPATNRLYIELPGVQDEKTVGEKLSSTANLEFFETYMPSQFQVQWQEASRISKEKEQEVVAIDDTTAVNDTLASTEKTEDLSLNSLSAKKKGLAELITPVGDYAVGYVDSKNKIEVTTLLRRKDVRAALPPDVEFMWSANPEKIDDKSSKTAYFLYACKVPESGKARVNGEHIAKASTGYDQRDGKITVDLEMTAEGSDEWGRMTSENVGRVVAITMDSVVYSAPRVINPITTGNTQISGSFTFEEAQDLAGLLNGGALPAPCVIKEQMKVGPTIGAENTRAGLLSFGLALILVFVYMYFYYGKAGLVADIALLANIIFIFGSLGSFGAVLTLAGIAGIVLTIGMAVDANVLIFERIREELTAGKDMADAIDTGFQKALSSIIDANVTTLLTAIVLKIFGSGPIESFATTLIIGIFTSVFSALVISRLVFTWMLNKNQKITFDSAVTKNAFKNLNINFLGKRKIYYAISGLLVVAALVSLFTKGLTPSVEFSGGRTYQVKFDKSADNNIEYIKENLGNSMKGASIDVKTKKTSYNVEITTNFMQSDETANEKVKSKLVEGLENCKSKLGKYEIEPESRFVSSTVSNELITSSSIAILLSLVIIFAYILLRFGSWQYSLSAILALAHDVTIVLGLFALFNGILPFNMDVDQAFIAAILTVIGYSINDTVVVFDRIREDLSWKKDADFHTEINGAMNSTLSRTLNTSFTTFIVLLIIFLFGGAAIKGFIFALLIGIVVGTYSSILVASPLLVDLTKKIKVK
ncbi:MAG: protein translocase subunit SecD [Flavobacteriales bacterium]|nr:protein translocase subunit SecD [Flavobacteriales bacterium]